MSFDITWPSNHKGHIIGPGDYELEIIVAAENVRPMTRTIAIALRGASSGRALWGDVERFHATSLIE